MTTQSKGTTFSVTVPDSAIDEVARKKIKALERKLANAEKRAEKWKSTAQRYETNLQDARQVMILAEEIGKCAGLTEEYF